MLRKVHLLTVLVALVLLASSAVQAMPLEGPVRASEEGVLARIWDWINSLFRIDNSSSDRELRPLWEGEGSHIDPHGGNG